MTFAEVERPHRIVEVGRTGKNNRMRTLGVYDLAPAAAGSTRVRFTLETVPVTLSDRLMEGLGGRAWLRRKNERAMHRLREILERSDGPGTADAALGAVRPASVRAGHSGAGRISVAGG